MIDILEATEYLRVDGDSNNEVIAEILKFIPSFIELSTGLTEQEQDAEPMCKQVSKNILELYYNATGKDVDKLERVINSLLKAIKLKHLNES